MNIEIKTKKSKKISITISKKDVVSNVVFNNEFKITDSFDPYKGPSMSRVDSELIKVSGVITINELDELEKNAIGGKVFDLCKWYVVKDIKVEKKNDKHAQVSIEALHKFKK
jgi:hypothetical protein